MVRTAFLMMVLLVDSIHGEGKVCTIKKIEKNINAIQLMNLYTTSYICEYIMSTKILGVTEAIGTNQ